MLLALITELGKVTMDGRRELALALAEDWAPKLLGNFLFVEARSPVTLSDIYIYLIII